MVRRLLVVVVAVLIVAALAVYIFVSGDGIRRALERQASAYLQQPVSIGSATATLFPRVGIELTEVTVGEPAAVTLAEVNVSTGLSGLLARRVEDAELLVANSRIVLPLPFEVFAPAEPGNTQDAVQGAGGGGLDVVSIRAITLQDVGIVSRGRELIVSADSSLIGSTLNLARFSVRSGATAAEASGVVQLEPALDATLEASANRLDFDDLLALVNAFTPERPSPAASGRVVPGRVAAKISAAGGSAGGVQFANLSGSLLARGDAVALSPVAFDLFGGRYEGSLEGRIGEQIALTITSRVADLDVAQLAAFGGVEDAITGRLSGTGRFTGRGADISRVLASATGSGEAAIASGVIRGLDLVRTVILFFGRPADDAPGSGGDRFERIAAKFSLQNQVIRAESLSLASSDVNVAAEGTLAIPTKVLDGRAELLLSESLSAQAGTDLKRYAMEGDRILLPATVGGTLSNPRVMIDPAAALQRGIRNEVERRLKGLLDRVRPPS